VLEVAHGGGEPAGAGAQQQVEVGVHHGVGVDLDASVAQCTGQCVELGARPRFDRFVRIDGPDGEMCAQTHSEWVLVDAATKRPTRVPEWMETMFG
jgi:acyl-CoA thioesterase FadM